MKNQYNSSFNRHQVKKSRGMNDQGWWQEETQGSSRLCEHSKHGFEG
jgi:hypothetical protein